ncbi:SDR family oxidoreductase [Candidatus Woesearchaeota archaeon]|nr:SDR family oxidoreductase [Candidatus Woesearchaeota archaeon]
MPFLKNKVVVITGASSGIGAASALAFAREGSTVVLVARRKERLLALQKKIRALGKECFVFPADISRKKEVEKLFSWIKITLGAVDVLVNNAGIARNSSLLLHSEKDMLDTFAVNFYGVFYCTQEAAKLMTERKMQGHIITVSSVLGLLALPNRSVYCASKHGVTGFMRALRWELKKEKIKVSLVHPAGVDTEIVSQFSKVRKRWSMLRSEDLAEYIAALASRSFLRILAVRFLNIFRRFYYLVKYYPK